MTPAELKDLLEPFGIKPLKARGQHFLLDEGVVRRMVDVSGITEGDPVLEIGPGPGILTAALLAAGADVVAVELDIRLQALLEERLVPRGLHLVRGDILTFANSDLVARFSGPAGSEGYRLVANLPYAITSRILEKFLTEEPYPSSITVMVQKEVAERICAGPGAMSALAVFVQSLAEVQRAAVVPRGAFLPPPKVDSSVIHMVRHTPSASPLREVSTARFFRVVRTAFAAPRKKLRNTVRGFFDGDAELEKSLHEAQIPMDARPAELSVDQWVSLVRLSGENGPK